MWWRSLAVILFMGSFVVAQQGITHKGFVISGNGGFGSVFDPVADQYIEEVTVQGIPAACIAYPSPTTADRLIVSQAGGELIAMDINTYTPLGNSNLTGPLAGSCRVNFGPWDDHIAVVAPNPGGTTSADLFMVVDPVNLTEYPNGTFGSGSMASSWKAICASHTDNNTPGDVTDDHLRYWIFDDGANGGVSRISYINLTYAQTLQDTGGPWGPPTTGAGPAPYGFPKLLVQLDENPNTMLELATVANHVGNCAWQSYRFNNVNYMLAVDSQQISTTPPAFITRLTVVNADTASVHRTTTIGSVYSQPPFLACDRADDYLITTEGVSASGSGGNVSRFVYLPDVINNLPPATFTKDSRFLTGIYGVKINIDNSKVYFGTDETDNRVSAYPVDLTHATTPITGGEISFNLLTQAEANTLNPPFRSFPLCFSFTQSGGGPFGGGGTGNGGGGGHSSGGGCSASTLARFGFLPIMVLVLLFGIGIVRKLVFPPAR